MVRTIDVLKVRKNLGELLERVDAQGSQYVIERSGRPMAAVKTKRRVIERAVGEAIEKTRARVRRRPA
jgi:antitoxin (DNA-binding transcriptional repressor) of toxin-antitoxin stability system